MRITNNMLVNNMIKYIGGNLSRMEKYQQQMATGKKISLPSDDPIIAARALRFRTDVSEIEQYKRNAEDASSWIEITEAAMEEVNSILQRARELAVQGSNGTQTPDDMQKIAEEIKQLQKQIIQVANSTYAGRQIFSGFKTDKKLMNDDGTFAISVSNSEGINYEIGVGDNININVLGGDLFNGGNDAVAGQKGKLIQDMENLVTALEAGDVNEISQSIGKMDENINNLLRIRADIGARTNRLDLTINRLQSDYLNFTKLMSINEDADMAETIMNLKNEENVYRASLAGGARIIQTTLVDFLK